MRAIFFKVVDLKGEVGDERPASLRNLTPSWSLGLSLLLFYKIHSVWLILSFSTGIFEATPTYANLRGGARRNILKNAR